MHAIEQAREYIRKLEAKVPPHLSAGGQRRSTVVLKVGTSSLVNAQTGIRLVRAYHGPRRG